MAIYRAAPEQRRHSANCKLNVSKHENRRFAHNDDDDALNKLSTP